MIPLKFQLGHPQFRQGNSSLASTYGSRLPSR
jgi:hypothetical protein